MIGLRTSCISTGSKSFEQSELYQWLIEDIPSNNILEIYQVYLATSHNSSSYSIQVTNIIDGIFFISTDSQQSIEYWMLFKKLYVRWVSEWVICYYYWFAIARLGPKRSSGIAKSYKFWTNEAFSIIFIAECFFTLNKWSVAN